MIGSYSLVYPNNVDTFPTWEDDVDLIAASIVNNLQNQLALVQSTLVNRIAPGEVARIMDTFSAGENIDAYEVVKGDFTKSQSNTANQSNICVALALETKNSSQDCDFLFRGFVTNSSWTWTSGADLYVSNSVSGELTETPPMISNAPAFSQKVAKAITATLIYFEPQPATFFAE